MLYGGHNTGLNKNGERVCRDDMKVESQMCLMRSTDGRNWLRHKNEQGGSGVFTGPGEARDPVLIQINGLWHLYYAGYEYPRGDEERDDLLSGFYVRTSGDLIHWSPAKLVHRDFNSPFGSALVETQCPVVVYKEGYYYLFRHTELCGAQDQCVPQ